MTADIGPLLHTVPDARRLLGDLGHTKFYELVAEGRIRIVKIGRRSYVAHTELERYVDSLDMESAR